MRGIELVPVCQSLADVLDRRIPSMLSSPEEIRCEAARQHTDHADTDQHQHCCNDTPCCCLRSDVLRTDRRDGDDRPPECLAVTVYGWLDEPEDRAPERDDTARDSEHRSKPILSGDRSEFSRRSPNPNASAKQTDEPQDTGSAEPVPWKDRDQLDAMAADDPLPIRSPTESPDVVQHEDAPDDAIRQLGFRTCAAASEARPSEWPVPPWSVRKAKRAAIDVRA